MSVGPIKRNSKLFGFNIINFDFPRWHSYDHENWDLLDALLGAYVSGAGLKGIWKNSTIYAVNDRVIDTSDSKIYLALVGHTSPASPTTFSSYRALNPTHWRQTTYDPEGRGTWTGPGTVYGKDDFVRSGYKYAVALLDHTSSALFSTDLAAGRWEVLIDLENTYADLQTQINNEITNRTADVDAEEAARIAADNLKANKAGDTFTGDIIIDQATPEVHLRDTDGTVDKRRISIGVAVDRFFLAARNDLDAVVRTIAEFIHAGGIKITSWTTAGRPPGETGIIGYNSDTNQFEGYAGAAWGSLGGGATGSAGDRIFALNDQTVDADYTIPAGQNAMTAGPVTVSTGVTVTVSTGSTWTVV